MGGKSSLVCKYTQGEFKENTESTIDDRYFKLVDYNGIKFKYQIIDTNGTDEYKFLLCDSIKESQSIILAIPYKEKSLKNILYYYNIIKSLYVKNSLTVPKKIILVMTKVHFTGNNLDNLLDEKIIKLCNYFKIETWIKTSAKHNIGINECFHTAFMNAYDNYNRIKLSSLDYGINIRYALTDTSENSTPSNISDLSFKSVKETPFYTCTEIPVVSTIDYTDDSVDIADSVDLVDERSSCKQIEIPDLQLSNTINNEDLMLSSSMSPTRRSSRSPKLLLTSAGNFIFKYFKRK